MWLELTDSLHIVATNFQAVQSKESTKLTEAKQQKTCLFRKCSYWCGSRIWYYSQTYNFTNLLVSSPTLRGNNNINNVMPTASLCILHRWNYSTHENKPTYFFCCLVKICVVKLSWYDNMSVEVDKLVTAVWKLFHFFNL